MPRCMYGRHVQRGTQDPPHPKLALRTNQFTNRLSPQIKLAGCTISCEDGMQVTYYALYLLYLAHQKADYKLVIKTENGTYIQVARATIDLQRNCIGCLYSLLREHFDIPEIFEQQRTTNTFTVRAFKKYFNITKLG